MKVAFRVDGSSSIGTGHVHRCLSLAHALRNVGAECSFVCRDLGVSFQAKITTAGCGYIELPAPSAPHDAPSASPAHAAWAEVGWQLDAAQSAEALGPHHPDWIVVDHYSFDARWHQAARQTLDCRLAAIDDLGDRPLDVALLIDHNHAESHQAKYRAQLPPGTSMLTGPRHALLGAAYRDAPRYVPRDKVRSIGIFMGGVDATNQTTLALETCRNALGFDGRIEIATSSANPHLPNLRRLADEHAADLSIDLLDLAAFFARHDVQVGAGGGATWERCCIGAPTVAITVADNQRMVLEPLQHQNVLLTCQATAEALAETLRRLIDDESQRRKLSDNAKRLVDGRGAERVAHFMRDA